MKRKRVQNEENSSRKRRKLEESPNPNSFLRLSEFFSTPQNSFIESLKDFTKQKQAQNDLGKCELTDFVDLLLLKHSYGANGAEEIRKRLEERIGEAISSLLLLYSERLTKIEDDNCDPITKSMINFPVILKKSGITYDKSSIMQCLEVCPQRKCPMTNVLLGEEENLEDYFVTNFDKKQIFERDKTLFLNQFKEFALIAQKLDFLPPEFDSSIVELITRCKVFENEELGPLLKVQRYFETKKESSIEYQVELLRKENTAMKKEMQLFELKMEELSFERKCVVMNYEHVKAKLSSSVDQCYYESSIFELADIKWLLRLEIEDNCIGAYLMNCDSQPVMVQFFIKYGERKYSSWLKFEPGNGWGTAKKLNLTLDVLKSDAKKYPDEQRYVHFVIGVKNVVFMRDSQSQQSKMLF